LHVLHGVHATRPPVEKDVPTGQMVHALELAGAAEPAPHKAHTASRVGEQAEAGANPTLHVVHALHTSPAMLVQDVPATQLTHDVAAPTALELPAAQSVQTRSAVAEPGCAAETMEPAAHVVHAAHEVAPAAENEPLAHAEHEVAPSAA
jgi:hypothetical protein